MGFVGNLVLFAAVKEFSKVIAMARVAPFFDSQCSYMELKQVQATDTS